MINWHVKTATCLAALTLLAACHETNVGEAQAFQDWCPANALPSTAARHCFPPLAAVIWKGILTEQPSFRRSAWKEVSDEAKDFVSTLLNKVRAGAEVLGLGEAALVRRGGAVSRDWVLKQRHSLLPPFSAAGAALAF